MIRLTQAINFITNNLKNIVKFKIRTPIWIECLHWAILSIAIEFEKILMWFWIKISSLISSLYNNIKKKNKFWFNGIGYFLWDYFKLFIKYKFIIYMEAYMPIFWEYIQNFIKWLWAAFLYFAKNSWAVWKKLMQWSWLCYVEMYKLRMLIKYNILYTNYTNIYFINSVQSITDHFEKFMSIAANDIEIWSVIIRNLLEKFILLLWKYIQNFIIWFFIFVEGHRNVENIWNIFYAWVLVPLYCILKWVCWFVKWVCWLLKWVWVWFWDELWYEHKTTPALFLYKPDLSSMLSIFNRICGIIIILSILCVLNFYIFNLSWTIFNFNNNYLSYCISYVFYYTIFYHIYYSRFKLILYYNKLYLLVGNNFVIIHLILKILLIMCCIISLFIIQSYWLYYNNYLIDLIFYIHKCYVSNIYVYFSNNLLLKQVEFINFFCWFIIIFCLKLIYIIFINLLFCYSIFYINLKFFFTKLRIYLIMLVFYFKYFIPYQLLWLRWLNWLNWLVDWNWFNYIDISLPLQFRESYKIIYANIFSNYCVPLFIKKLILLSASSCNIIINLSVLDTVIQNDYILKCLCNLLKCFNIFYLTLFYFILNIKQFSMVFYFYCVYFDSKKFINNIKDIMDSTKNFYNNLKKFTNNIIELIKNFYNNLKKFTNNIIELIKKFYNNLKKFSKDIKNIKDSIKIFYNNLKIFIKKFKQDANSFFIKSSLLYCFNIWIWLRRHLRYVLDQWWLFLPWLWRSICKFIYSSLVYMMCPWKLYNYIYKWRLGSGNLVFLFYKFCFYFILFLNIILPICLHYLINYNLIFSISLLSSIFYYAIYIYMFFLFIMLIFFVMHIYISLNAIMFDYIKGISYFLSGFQFRLLYIYILGALIFNFNKICNSYFLFVLVYHKYIIFFFLLLSLTYISLKIYINILKYNKYLFWKNNFLRIRSCLLLIFGFSFFLGILIVVIINLQLSAYSVYPVWITWPVGGIILCISYICEIWYLSEIISDILNILQNGREYMFNFFNINFNLVHKNLIIFSLSVSYVIIDWFSIIILHSWEYFIYCSHILYEHGKVVVLFSIDWGTAYYNGTFNEKLYNHWSTVIDQTTLAMKKEMALGTRFPWPQAWFIWGIMIKDSNAFWLGCIYLWHNSMAYIKYQVCVLYSWKVFCVASLILLLAFWVLLEGIDALISVLEDWYDYFRPRLSKLQSKYRKIILILRKKD